MEIPGKIVAVGVASNESITVVEELFMSSWNQIIHYLPLVPSLEIPGRVVTVGVPNNECIIVV